MPIMRSAIARRCRNSAAWDDSFPLTLKYSGKSFRTTVWKTDQQIWARLHEDAFRAFGGCPRTWCSTTSGRA